MKETSFKHKVFSVVRRIPAGKTLTYKQVAEKTGYPRAFRAVGNILNTNYDPAIPCHRVVRSDGTTGGYNMGSGAKSSTVETGTKFPRYNFQFPKKFKLQKSHQEILTVRFLELEI